MSKLIVLAWRNVWRNRRRSFITMFAIIFAVFIIGVSRSLQYGTYDAMESSAVQLFSGDIQIQGKHFQQEQTLNESFAESLIDREALHRRHPEITASAARLTAFGLVSSDSSSAGAVIVGIEPEREAEVSRFSTRIFAGESLIGAGRNEILLGDIFAANLQVSPGDSVIILTQGYRNELGADTYRVRGLLRSGSRDLDRTLLVMRLADARELFAMHGRLTQLVLRTNDFRRAHDYAAQIAAGLPQDELDILAWQQLLPELEQLIMWDNVSGMIFLFFLVLVVGFEILNTTLMSIVERMREFGVLQAIGVKPAQIGGMITLESFFKIMISLAIGLSLLAALVYSMQGQPIQLTKEMEEAIKAWGFSIDIYFSTRLRVFFEPLFSIAVISLLSIIWPIYMTLRLRPVEAMHKT